MFPTSDSFPSYSTNFLGSVSWVAKGNLRHFFPTAETIAITLLLPLTSRETWKCQLWIKCTNFLSDKWDWRAAGCNSYWDKTLIKWRQTSNQYRRDALACSFSIFRALRLCSPFRGILAETSLSSPHKDRSLLIIWFMQGFSWFSCISVAFTQGHSCS